MIDIESEISNISSGLLNDLDKLRGNGFDNKGIQDFKNLLTGENGDEK